MSEKDRYKPERGEVFQVEPGREVRVGLKRYIVGDTRDWSNRGQEGTVHATRIKKQKGGVSVTKITRDISGDQIKEIGPRWNTETIARQSGKRVSLERVATRNALNMSEPRDLRKRTIRERIFGKR